MRTFGKVAIVVITIIGMQFGGTNAQVPNCSTNGAFACPTPATDLCDYYTCAYYASLNRWFQVKRVCLNTIYITTPGEAEETCPQIWNDTLKRCEDDIPDGAIVIRREPRS